MKRHLPIAGATVLLGAALFLKSLRRNRAIDFRDRVALITGGSRGLGLLIARELGRLGARVVLAARDEHELARAKSDLQERGVAVATVVTDLSTPAEAERAVDECIDAFGRLDVLVNNAGVITVGPFEHMSNVDFQEAMSIHFWAPLYTLQAALPFMRMNGGGRIGYAELVITWSAKLAAAAAGVTPRLTATATDIANRLLPGPTDDVDGEASHSGWQSGSEWAPSALTRLSERAAARNNELP